VDPEWIVRAKQLMFEERTDFPDGVYGALFRSGNCFGILVSTGCPGDGHRRFTIAHELGHYHLPGHVERLFPDEGDGNAVSLGGHFRGKKDPLEVEADYFANELLMPERLVRPLVRRLGNGVSAISTLANEFRTSMSAAAIRYSSITSEPVAMLISRDGVIEWTAISPALWEHRWARVTMKKEWAPRGSGTRRLSLAPDRVRQGQADSDSMLLCEWFQGAPPSVHVIEEAIGLGLFGRVLTVLIPQDLTDPESDDEGEQDPDDGRTHDWRDALRTYRMD
jgi:hypothetical protein